MKIFLLTHQRELNRKNNTGILALKSISGLVERITWDRVNPNIDLLKLIESQSIALLYPSPDSIPIDIQKLDYIIILDGTWQEAKKIYNKSEYLKSTQKVTFSEPMISTYKLRKNQQPKGLCTIECIIEILKLKQKFKLVNQLTNEFMVFNKQNP